MNVRIDDSQLRMRLNKLKRSAQNNVVGGIIRKNVVPLVRTMKELAPERAENMFYISSKKKVSTSPNKRAGKPYKAGNLKKSIGTKTFSGYKGDLAVYVGPHHASQYDGWYAMFLELGTKGYGGPIGAGRGRKQDRQKYNGAGIQATHFISKAANATVPTITNNLEKDTAEYIERLARKNKL